MSASRMLHNRRTLFFLLLFIASSAFTLDILDLREELHILSYPHSSIDSNVTTCVVCSAAVVPEPISSFCLVHRKVSVKISFIDLLPYGLRAPPSWS
jgi:hypothetical protein